MFNDFGFDFSRADPVTRGLNHIVIPSLKVDIALVIHMTHIAGQTPFAGKLLTHRARISPVFFHHDGTSASDGDLTGFAGPNWLAVNQNCHLMTWISLSQRFQ